MDEKTTECPLCGSVSPVHVDYQLNRIFYGCPVCGRYDWGVYDQKQFNHNHLASYLAHHRFPYDHYEYRYHTTLDKETCDQYNKEHEQDEVKGRRPVHMDSDMVENWFPKTFSERVDYILLYIDANTPHIGQQTIWSPQEAKSALFIDRYENGELRSAEALRHEVTYMLNCLQESAYIQFVWPPHENGNIIISLTPEGYKRVDELQKYSSHGHNAFVAMQFGDNTMPLREAIRKGITDAGYNAILIDEVQHNELITPELLKCIRDSKFVVAELTHQNNGAYFEEGYAMGLGKPVIQLCKHGSKLHFDIAQKNTILWDTEDDIPLRLANRIKATID